ncbi:glycerophosphodiester phosphodiesterase family protein [Actinocorallia sp. B10E7]|uniref:glycerophosphodiester phosphodiesterase n=1 Tax=Actinocorallia sp. B10E7 TaxID=3153558 RepID=UPI00325F39EB
MRIPNSRRWARNTALAALAAAVSVPLAVSAPAHAAPAKAPEPIETVVPAEDLFPYPDADLTLVNHRGLSPGHPENTLAAFRNSIALGVDAIEIDLRSTGDGAIVIMHDDTVDRTTDGTGRVRDLTLEQIKALDAGGGERVPTYAETLATLQGTGVRLLLDIKESSRIPEIVELTERYDMASDVIVGPRTVQALNEFKALNPGLRTLGFIPTPADADAFIAAGVDYIRLWPHWITDSRDSAACRADYAARVAAYENGERAVPGSASCVLENVVAQGTPVWSTVNDAPYESMDELLRLGATGLLSDLPGVLAQLLDDVEGERFTAAGRQVKDLAAQIEHDSKNKHSKRGGKHFVKESRRVLRELRDVSRHIAAGETEQACTVLEGTAEAVRSASFPAAFTTAYLNRLAHTGATLACSRFA